MYGLLYDLLLHLIDRLQALAAELGRAGQTHLSRRSYTFDALLIAELTLQFIEGAQTLQVETQQVVLLATRRHGTTLRLFRGRCPRCRL